VINATWLTAVMTGRSCSLTQAVTRSSLSSRTFRCRPVRALPARAWRTRRTWSTGAANTSTSKRYHCGLL